MQTGYVLRDIAPPHLRAPVQDSSDAALISLIADGDKRAMQVLYARHNVRVYRFILRLTGNQSLAEDLVSEVFLDVWRQAEGFESKSQVSTWLLAIARYKALSALRRRTDEHLDDQMAAAIEDTADNPETMVGTKDRNIIVQKCLGQLSPAHREVIDLVYYHEKSVDEVAKIVGVPPATVKTRMFYKMADLLRDAGVSAV
ncbi:MAG: sigma-70 family RNA polymerase sigma factor [Alphaproteobacteria bacterium]|nr:MAG: sigma-70 family RNA polymerase sigma factor [Alphaproteobacteria bacterium]